MSEVLKSCMPYLASTSRYYGVDVLSSSMHSLLWLSDVGYTWPSDKDMAAIPWANISHHPGDYYDTDRFMVPFNLRAPDHLKPSHLWSLTEYLLSMEDDALFVFRDKADIKKRTGVCQAEAEAEQEVCDEDFEDTSSDERVETRQWRPGASGDTVISSGGDDGPAYAPAGGGDIDGLTGGFKDTVLDGSTEVTSSVGMSEDGVSVSAGRSDASADEDEGSDRTPQEDSDESSEPATCRPQMRNGGKQRVRVVREVFSHPVAGLRLWEVSGNYTLPQLLPVPEG